MSAPVIPLPHADPVLPGMRVALDGDTIAALFDLTFARWNVRSCTPYYVKYKPSRYCRVQYELEVVDMDRGTSTREGALVSMYPAARAHKLAARDRQGTRIPELCAIAHVFPRDPGLPGLVEAASPQAMARRFERALPEPAQSCEIELVRYKATKRAVLKYRLGGSSSAYGKLRKDGGNSLLRIAGALSVSRVPTPETLTFFSDLGMIVQAEGAGVRLGDLRNSTAYDGWMPAVAETLAHLHGTAIDSLPSYSAATEAAELMDSASTISRLLPHLASESEALARRLAPMLSSIDGATRTIHGSFHDDQVLVGDQGVTFVDMDSAAIANPGIDVGHFLAYLSAEGADDARESFLTAYADARGEATDHLVFEAASLLRWAALPFRELRPDWPEALEYRVRGAAARLDDYLGGRCNERAPRATCRHGSRPTAVSAAVRLRSGDGAARPGSWLRGP